MADRKANMRIVLDHVNLRKDNKEIIKNVSCSFTEGLTYIVGKNGAGKSELLKFISTLVESTNGAITYSKLVRDPKEGTFRKRLSIKEVREIIGFMPQHFKGHSDMTIKRYLKYIAFHKGIPNHLIRPLLERWLKETHLFKLRSRKLRTLSGGERQKVGLIQALINQPRICILDEPFEGLDAQEKRFFKGIIQRLSFHSIVIISTHLVEDIERSRLVNLLYIDEGQLLFNGRATEINHIVREIQEK